MSLDSGSWRGRTPFSCSSTAVIVLALGCGGRATSQDDDATNHGSGGTRDSGTLVGDTGGTTQTSGDTGGQSTHTSSSVSTGTGGTVAISSGQGATSPGMTKVSCAAVTCPALPNACTRVVQPANECCAKCIEDTCEPCAPLDCVAGTHLETVVGDCCPSCVADPPSQCEKDSASYESSRVTLISKYGSSGCSTSPDCTIVSENNACASTCGIPIPKSSAENLERNLTKTSLCSSCPLPPQILCEQMVPACVNGKCVAADPN